MKIWLFTYGIWKQICQFGPFRSWDSSRQARGTDLYVNDFIKEQSAAKVFPLSSRREDVTQQIIGEDAMQQAIFPSESSLFLVVSLYYIYHQNLIVEAPQPSQALNKFCPSHSFACSPPTLIFIWMLRRHTCASLNCRERGTSWWLFQPSVYLLHDTSFHKKNASLIKASPAGFTRQPAEVSSPCLEEVTPCTVCPIYNSALSTKPASSSKPFLAPSSFLFNYHPRWETALPIRLCCDDF